jgi:hypothetical protein
MLILMTDDFFRAEPRRHTSHELTSHDTTELCFSLSFSVSIGKITDAVRCMYMCMCVLCTVRSNGTVDETGTTGAGTGAGAAPPPPPTLPAPPAPAAGVPVLGPQAPPLGKSSSGVHSDTIQGKANAMPVGAEAVLALKLDRYTSARPTWR